MAVVFPATELITYDSEEAIATIKQGQQQQQ